MRLRSLIPALIAAAAAMPASELVVPLGDNYHAVLDPGLGMLQVFHIQGSHHERRLGSFLISEIESLERRMVTQVGGTWYSALRLGIVEARQTDPSSIPTGNQIQYGGGSIPSLEQALTAGVNRRNTAPGAEPQAVRIRDMEDAWWNVDRPYDGKLVAGGNADHLLVGVPSKRALLLYRRSDMDNPKGRLLPTAYRGMGAEMYVPLTWGPSDPDFSKGVSGWAKDAIRARFSKPDEQKQAEAAATEAIERMQLGPGVAAAAAPVSTLPQPELWIGGIDKGFVVVDGAGRRAYLFKVESNRLILRAVRNFGMDLTVLGIAGEPFNSKPTDGEQLIAVLKDSNNLAQALRYRLIELPTEPREQREALRSQLASLATSQRKSTGTAGGGIEGRVIGEVTGASLVVVNLTSERKVITFKIPGSEQLNVLSARDYTIDQGITVLYRLIEERRGAEAVLAQLGSNAAQYAPETMRKGLESVLKLNPFLVEQVEKGSAFAKFRTEPWYQPMVDAAKAQAAELDAQFKARTAPPKAN